MLTGLQHMHSALRWVLIVLLVWVVIKSLMGKGGRFFDKTRKLALFTMITAHIQLLLGFSIYFMKGYHQLIGGDSMGNALLRFLTVEHMVGMLLAIILITIGYKQVKKADTDLAKYRKLLTFYGLGFLLILVSIPWPFRFENYGWF